MKQKIGIIIVLLLSVLLFACSKEEGTVGNGGINSSSIKMNEKKAEELVIQHLQYLKDRDWSKLYHTLWKKESTEEKFIESYNDFPIQVNSYKILDSKPYENIGYVVEYEIVVQDDEEEEETTETMEFYVVPDENNDYKLTGTAPHPLLYAKPTSVEEKAAYDMFLYLISQKDGEDLNFFDEHQRRLFIEDETLTKLQAFYTIDLFYDFNFDKIIFTGNVDELNYVLFSIEILNKEGELVWYTSFYFPYIVEDDDYKIVTNPNTVSPEMASLAIRFANEYQNNPEIQGFHQYIQSMATDLEYMYEIQHYEALFNKMMGN